MANERLRAARIREESGRTTRSHRLSPNQKDHEITQEWDTIIARFNHKIENYFDFYGINVASPKPDLPGVEPTQSVKQPPERTVGITQLTPK